MLLTLNNKDNKLDLILNDNEKDIPLGHFLLDERNSDVDVYYVYTSDNFSGEIYIGSMTKDDLMKYIIDKLLLMVDKEDLFDKLDSLNIKKPLIDSLNHLYKTIEPMDYIVNYFFSELNKVFLLPFNMTDHYPIYELYKEPNKRKTTFIYNYYEIVSKEGNIKNAHEIKINFTKKESYTMDDVYSLNKELYLSMEKLNFKNVTEWFEDYITNEYLKLI